MVLSIRSNKGVETAPLVIAFAAAIIMITTMIVLPQLGQWNAVIDEQKTFREAKRLATACNETFYMGEPGSAQEIHIEVPKDCFIRVTDATDKSSIYAVCNKPNRDQMFEKISLSPLFLQTRMSNYKIEGESADIVILYREDKTIFPDGTYIVYVSETDPASMVW